MKKYNLKISEGHITGFGIGPITNENTLIKFVLRISEKINIRVRNVLKNYKNFFKNRNSRKMYIVEKKSVYL
ncbi:hypothetical protein [uncultured Maribacter sp.]|uniref:hypothetical protein n=1 Tax=uncultured Maribacter sp. TaxID=431308 RepID=UPI002612FB4C|nr:hypothetical protein [uncultured Maribacter sp.]